MIEHFQKLTTFKILYISVYLKHIIEIGSDFVC